jgi:hypothetical protein
MLKLPKVEYSYLNIYRASLLTKKAMESTHVFGIYKDTGFLFECISIYTICAGFTGA